MSNSQKSVTLAEGLTEAVSSLSKDIVSKLSVEQQAALESKFNALAEEVRSSIRSKYLNMSVVEMYIVRQMVREANGKLASNKRPVWFNTITINVDSLKSGDENVREYGEKKLRELAEEIDSKESTTLLKKYKNTKDLTSKSDIIVQLCGIFGISPDSLK